MIDPSAKTNPGIIDSPGGGHFYGLPIFGVPGFKLGRLSRHLDEVDPDLPLLEPDSREEQDLRQFLEKHFADANGSLLSMQTAFFEHSPDRHFIIDELVDFPGAWVIAGLSGHGFKYASALGELAKDLVVRQKSGYDLSPVSVKAVSRVVGRAVPCAPEGCRGRGEW